MKTTYYLTRTDGLDGQTPLLVTPPVTGAAIVAMTPIARETEESAGTTTLTKQRVIIAWVLVEPND